MDALREVIATLYLAAAYAGGPRWLEKANEYLAEYAEDPETGCQAAWMLRTLVEETNHLHVKRHTLRLADLVAA